MHIVDTDDVHSDEEYNISCIVSFAEEFFYLCESCLVKIDMLLELCPWEFFS